MHHIHDKNTAGSPTVAMNIVMACIWLAGFASLFSIWSEDAVGIPGTPLRVVSQVAILFFVALWFVVRNKTRQD